MRTRSTRRFGCSALRHAAAFAILLIGANAPAASHPARTPWDQARAARATLEATPERSRTRALYSRAIEAFRAVFYDDPANLHAPASIFAVADLLAMEGRGLHLPSASQAAVTQYRFLRTQYPESSLIPPALLAEARIDQNDLKDASAAHATYALLLKTHPSSPQARAARTAFNSTSSRSPAPAGPSEPPATVPTRKPEPPPSEASTTVSKPSIVASPSLPAASPSQQTASTSPVHRATLPPMPTTGDAADAQRLIHVPAREVAAPAPASHAAQPNARSQPAPNTAVAPPASRTAPPPNRPFNHAAAIVTGIRHWSTPSYTRVAIDLGDDVTYEAARVPNPDRLLFDLHGTRLSSALVNKTFNVTDDGFLRKIRAAQSDTETTRVVLDVSGVSDYSAFLLPNPYRLIIDIHGRGQESAPAGGSIDDGTINDVRTLGERVSALPSRIETTHAAPSRSVPDTTATPAPGSAAGLAAVGRQPGKVDATAQPTSKPIVAIVPLASLPDARAASGKHVKPRSPNATAPAAIVGAPARGASPTAAGETSLIRALGLKVDRIVIDAGHGGHDSGTLGAGGIQEKDVVLDVALRLGRLLHERLGAEIIYTRSDDTFVPLETRTAIANQAQADLFLSIHANSSPDATARGVETYYLNFTSQADALEVAARENAVSGQSIHQLSDLVKKIALKDKIEESREFASDVERSLYGGLGPGSGGLKDRGVKKAPFVVLIGANMPSVLAEISFVTNERDAEQMRRPEYRQRVAESLYKGVAKYQAGLGESRASVERIGGN